MDRSFQNSADKYARQTYIKYKLWWKRLSFFGILVRHARELNVIVFKSIESSMLRINAQRLENAKHHRLLSLYVYLYRIISRGRNKNNKRGTHKSRNVVGCSLMGLRNITELHMCV